MRVLVVEDESRMAGLLKRALQEEGRAVDVAADGREGMWLATENAYGAIVLDVMLPGLDGIGVCRRLREAGSWVPMLLLTARDGVGDRVRGWSATGMCRPGGWVARAPPSGRVPCSRSGSTRERATTPVRPHWFLAVRRGTSRCRRDSSGGPAAAPSPSVTEPPPEEDRPMISIPPEASATRRAMLRPRPVDPPLD